MQARTEKLIGMMRRIPKVLQSTQKYPKVPQCTSHQKRIVEKFYCVDNQIGLFVTQIYPIIVDVSSKRMVSKDFCIATPQVKGHMCYSPLKVSSEIALRKLNEQKHIFTIWEKFVPELFIQTAVSRERNEIS